MKLQVTGLPGWLVGSRIRLQCRRPGFDPWVGKIPWRREWLLTAVFLPRESHGQRSQVGYSHWGRKESGTTEQLTLSFSLHQVITLWKHLDDYTSLHHFSQNHFLIQSLNYPTHDEMQIKDFPHGPAVTNLPASAGDTGSIPDLGRFHMLRGH